jgi:hypothetical protein
MRRSLWITVCALLVTNQGQCQKQTPAVTIEAAPARPIVEVRDGDQFVVFDMEVRNLSAEPLRISQIEVSVYDPAGQLVQRRSLNTDAFAPSIAVIGEQVLKPGASLDIFNPFSEFPPYLPLSRLEYSFCLERELDEEREPNRHRLFDDCDFRRQLTVTPVNYEDKTALILPLQGRIFIWEGHDFYAHHARVPMGDPRVRRLGISANSNQFAEDFIYLDAQGRRYHDDPRKLENWHSYGRPIYAPGPGVVAAAANDIPENWFENEAATKIGHPKLRNGQDPKDIGNFVLIDHRNGEYSLLVHMKSGSVSVQPGDRVEQGELVGRIGFSGDSIFPHLHYSLMGGPELFKAWGLPAYFLQFHRAMGTVSIPVKRGTVDSGDFVESDANYFNPK